jgi:hypothetical protein
MDSPHRELFSDILFAKFRCRLSHFPFSLWFSVEKNRAREGEIAAKKKGEDSVLWSPLSVKEMKKLSWCGLGRRGVQKPVPQFIINETPRECTKSIQLFSSFQIPPAPKLISSVLGVPYLHPARFPAPSCTQVSP